MLAFFPELLFLAPFAITLLRLTVAVSVLYIAYVHWQRREEIGAMRFPIVGSVGAWFIAFGSLIEAIIGAALFIGYATQFAAILAFVMAFKHVIYAKKYPRAIPLCRADYVYLMVMSFALLLLGAGALAFDLPL